MKKDRKYRFYEKPQAVGGKFALILSGLSLAFFLVSVFISFYNEGNAGIAAGATALIGMLLSVCAFLSGVRSFREKDTSPGASIAGTMIGGAVMLGWLAIFLIGIR